MKLKKAVIRTLLQVSAFYSENCATNVAGVTYRTSCCEDFVTQNIIHSTPECTKYILLVLLFRVAYTQMSTLSSLVSLHL